MKLLALHFLFVLVVALNTIGLQPLNAQTTQLNQKIYKFSNGNWFDGKNFKRQTFYSVNGILTLRKPKRVDETIDLKNGFVIPPFGDAHTHNLDGKYNLDKMIDAYLAEGTFYVQVLTNYQTGAAEAKPFLNKPESLDVIYANGGLTSTFGHPFLAYEPRVMGIYSWSDTQSNIEKVKQSRIAADNAYWFFDSIADVDAKWEKFMAGNPDIVKIYLLDAASQSKLKLDDNIGSKGLLPEVAEYIVKRAHAANRRVYAHIETAADFRLGLKIGVDGFAHAPYYDWDGKLETKPQDDLTIADIKLAAAKNVVVIPTAARGIYKQTDYDANGKGTLNQERFGRVIERYRKLFNEMHRNGVKLAFGLDTYGTTLMPEIWYFHDNKIFDNRTLLKIAVETTPQTIFPNRQIGRLREGYEASFLVLKGNPLEDFSQIKNIESRFKQGVFISVEEKP